jgi:hypothetical protein
VTYYLDLPGRPVDWDEVAELVQESYIIQAPTRLGCEEWSRVVDRVLA